MRKIKLVFKVSEKDASIVDLLKSEKTVVHLRSVSDYHTLLELLKPYGINKILPDGEYLVESLKGKLCVNLKDNLSFMYSPIDFYRDRNYEILTINDLQKYSD